MHYYQVSCLPVRWLQQQRKPHRKGQTQSFPLRSHQLSQRTLAARHWGIPWGSHPKSQDPPYHTGLSPHWQGKKQEEKCHQKFKLQSQGWLYTHYYAMKHYFTLFSTHKLPLYTNFLTWPGMDTLAASTFLVCPERTLQDKWKLFNCISEKQSILWSCEIKLN